MPENSALAQIYQVQDLPKEVGCDVPAQTDKPLRSTVRAYHDFMRVGVIETDACSSRQVEFRVVTAWTLVCASRCLACWYVLHCINAMMTVCIFR